MMILRTPTLRNNRDILLLEIPVKKEKTIHYEMCKNWNELPLNIRKSETLINFKKDLKTHYFNQAFGSDSGDKLVLNSDESDFE